MSHSHCLAHGSSDAPSRSWLHRSAAKWHALPLLCNLCCYPIDADSVSENEQIGWCPNCKRTFHVSLFRIPGWVAGVIVILLIKAQAGC